MKYTVIIPNGRVMTFYLESVARTYAQAYRGTLITPEMLTVFKRMSNV
jgi:hypothetical protein